MNRQNHFLAPSSIFRKLIAGVLLNLIVSQGLATPVRCTEQMVKQEILEVRSSPAWQKKIEEMSLKLQGYHLDPCGRSKLRDEGLYLFIQEMREGPARHFSFSQDLHDFTIDPEAKGIENSYVFAEQGADGSWNPALHLETDNFRIDRWPTENSAKKRCSAKALVDDLSSAVEAFVTAKYCPMPALTPTAVVPRSISSAFFVDFRTHFR